MSKIEELIERLCPNGVEYKTIGEVATYRRGSFPQPYTNSSFYGGDGAMPFVQVADIEDNGFKLKEKTKQTISKIAQPKSIYVPKGTVICSIQGTIGRVAITQFDSYIDRTIAIFESFKIEINKRFFAYCIELKFGIEKQFARGSTLKTITKEEFTKFRIPVPPLEVQCEIVHILDDFILLSAELSAELKARQKQYEYYKNKIFNDVVSEKTEFKKLNEITDVRDGTHDSPKPVNVGKYLVTSKNIKNGTVNFDGSYLISEKDYNLINQRSKVDKNDLLFTMIGTIGEVGIVEQEPDYAIKNVGLIKTNNILLSKFLFYYLTSNDVKKYIENNKSKGSQVFLALGKLRNIPIPVLSDVIVEKIVNILDRFDKLCNDISEGLPAEIEARQKQYEYYRDKLLTFKELKVNE